MTTYRGEIGGEITRVDVARMSTFYSDRAHMEAVEKICREYPDHFFLHVGYTEKWVCRKTQKKYVNIDAQLCVSGSMKVDETLMNCVRREIYEETYMNVSEKYIHDMNNNIYSIDMDHVDDRDMWDSVKYDHDAKDIRPKIRVFIIIHGSESKMKDILNHLKKQPMEQDISHYFVMNSINTEKYCRFLRKFEPRKFGRRNFTLDKNDSRYQKSWR